MALFGAPNVAKLQEDKNIKGLTKALGHQKDWEVRRDAARALGKICHIRNGAWNWLENGPPPCVEPLIAMVSDANSEVSHAAVWALCQLGDRRGLALLTAIRQDENASPELRRAVERAYDVRNFSAFTEYMQIWSTQGAAPRRR